MPGLSVLQKLHSYSKKFLVKWSILIIVDNVSSDLMECGGSQNPGLVYRPMPTAGDSH